MADQAQLLIDFIQELRIPEGMNQGDPFVLRPWQQEIIRGVYGPVDENGKRIVRKAIYSVGKKNGKTPMVAGIALAHLMGQWQTVTNSYILLHMSETSGDYLSIHEADDRNGRRIV